MHRRTLAIALGLALGSAGLGVQTIPAHAVETTQFQQAQARRTTFESKVVELVNIERSKRGLRPLRQMTCLNNVAERWSATMARTGNFDHQNLSALERCGRGYLGENIAGGSLSPERAVEMWMASPGHRANILHRRYTHIGVGWVETGPGTGYATQDFLGIR